MRDLSLRSTSMGALQSTLQSTLQSQGWLSPPHSHGNDGPADPAQMLRLSLALRRKLGNGAKLNVKLLVRGDMSTGKSSLLRRLQGLPFQPDQPPSREINTGHVDWSAPDVEDTVKVEVWDVCDTAKAGAASTDRLALRHGESGPAARLDADSIDVFRGAHGVVYVFDPRKRWTFEYVQRQLPSVPARMPVLIFMNFSDLVTDEPSVEGSGEGSPGRAKPVTMAEVEDLAQRESQRRGRAVLAASSSMADCYGLDLLYDFLQLPYCFAKELALEKALETTAGRRSRAEENLKGLASTQEYLAHRHRLLELRDRGGAAPSVLELRASRGPPERASPPPPSSGTLNHTPYALPPQTPGTAAGDAPAARPTPLTSPPRLAPPPGSAGGAGGLQMQHLSASSAQQQPSPPPTRGTPAAPPPSLGAPPSATLSIASSAGMDTDIDDSFFGDDDGPAAPAMMGGGGGGGGRGGAAGGGAVMGMLALDEPDPD